MKMVLASASVIDEVRDPRSWQKTLTKFNGKIVKASTKQIALKDYPPDKYLFTHSTIVSSVDLDNYKSHYITPETAKFVNDNGDAWSRQIIASTYSSFIGAPNYLEHVQVPDLRKGWILDAALREVPDSLYVDILVATDRKHKDLIRDIEAGTMKTMSMGALVQYTICSKCGNVSFSNEDSCDCIRSMKRSSFLDERGILRVIAEICGHHSDPSSNRFCEASWVRDPAFKGAVTRSILNPSKELLARLENLERVGKVFDKSNMKRKVAYAVYQQGPSERGTYPYYFFENQTPTPSGEDHSVEESSSSETSREPRILQDEMSEDYSLFVGSSDRFDNYFIRKLGEASIHFKDVLDFVDFYSSMFGSRAFEAMNDLVKLAIKERVIRK